MTKITKTPTEVTFELSSKDVRTILERGIEDMGQMLGYSKDTTFSFIKDGRCVVKTLHYGSDKDDKVEEL